MTKNFLASLLILAFTAAMAPVARSQGNPDKPQEPVKDWQGLRNLKPGKPIVVYTRRGQEFEGKFVDIQGSTLGLALDFNILDFEQSEIEEVRQKPGSRRKGRIIGTLIGAFVGGMIATPIGLRMEANQTGPPSPDSPAPVITGLGVVGGGALGYAIGLRFDNKRKGKLLYKSR